MFELEGIDHVALGVRDVERSIAWYQDVLGLERRFESVWGNRPAILARGTTSLALFQVREGAADPAAPLPAVRFLHLAFRVNAASFAAAQADLTARGIAFTFQDHQAAHSIYFEDPDGHKLEITTYELPAPPSS